MEKQKVVVVVQGGVVDIFTDTDSVELYLIDYDNMDALGDSESLQSFRDGTMTPWSPLKSPESQLDLFLSDIESRIVDAEKSEELERKVLGG